MPLKLEKEPKTLLKVTIDTTAKCNLVCSYCLQGDKDKTYLPASKIAQSLHAAEKTGFLETYLVGAEITLHPQLEEILELTHVLDKTGSVILTNGITLNEEIISMIRKSNLSRVCISIDGASAETHNANRGKNFDKVMRGLNLLQDCGKPIVVISVVTKNNIHNVVKLSKLLATQKLAQQHHIITVSKSGLAKEEYDKMKLSPDDIESVQKQVADVHQDLLNMGLFTTFSSYWPTTGQLPNERSPRMLTTFELSEQLKNSNVVIRANGAVNPTNGGWAREFGLGSPAIGNIFTQNPEILFQLVKELYKDGNQFTREYEAIQKYGLPKPKNPQYQVDTIPIIQIDDLPIMAVPLASGQLDELANNIRTNQDQYRAIKSSGKTIIVYNKPSSHAILLTPKEYAKLIKKI